MKNLYALIMAGGGGTRLWPLSRKGRPKQMLPLVEDRTMFQISVERLEPLLTPEQVFIVTGRDQVDQLCSSAPQIPAANFLLEPFGQNNGPAVGLAMLHLRRVAPDGLIAVLAADHHIANKAKFRQVLAAAGELATQGYIVTLGITPTFPSTGYGYIERGTTLPQVGGFETYQAARFIEKPDLATATRFVADERYSWNSGMFIFKIEQAMAEYARQQPQLYALLQEIDVAIGTDRYQAVLDRVWPQMPKISIDYAIMEKADRMAVIPVEMGWSDIGSWATLYDVLESDANGIVTRGQGQGHIHIDTRDTLVFSDRRVVTIGLEDLVIVDTSDVLFLCRRDRSQDVRKVIDQLKAAGDEAPL
jgi:mannose-1-phosphate guanylyltransferase